MSYIPSIRNRYKERMFKGTHGDIGEREKNPYWEGYLPNKAATYLNGYDSAVGKAVDDFFVNLDMCRGDLLEAGFRVGKVDAEVMLNDRPYEDYEDEEIENMNDETRVMLILRSALSLFLEGKRNEYGVACLDTLADDKEQEERERMIDTGYLKPAKFEGDSNE